MACVVHHYRPLHGNQLDQELLASAIRRALEPHLKGAVWIDLPVCDGPEPSAGSAGLLHDNVDRSNAEADLVILSGSGLLQPRRASCPGRIVTDIESIHRLHPPLVMLGVGGNGEPSSRRTYCERARAEFRLLHAHALATSVNDEPARRQLASLGVESECIGSPLAFYTNHAVAPESFDLPLLVALPPKQTSRGLSGTSQWTRLHQYIETLCDEGHNVAVVLHDVADLDQVRDWVPSGVDLFWTTEVEQLVERYRTSCGVIGFRAESVLLALGLGKPVIPVALDQAGAAVVETFGLHADSVGPRRWGQFRKLHKQTARLLDADHSLSLRLDQAKARLHIRFEQFVSQSMTAFHAARAGDALSLDLRAA